MGCTNNCQVSCLRVLVTYTGTNGTVFEENDKIVIYANKGSIKPITTDKTVLTNGNPSVFWSKSDQEDLITAATILADIDELLTTGTEGTDFEYRECHAMPGGGGGSAPQPVTVNCYLLCEDGFQNGTFSRSRRGGAGKSPQTVLQTNYRILTLQRVLDIHPRHQRSLL